MAYLTPLSVLEKMSQDAAFRREGEDEMREKETSSNKSTPSNILASESLVVTISEDAQNQMVRVILPLSFPYQAHPHLKFNPPPKARLYRQPQESAASFNTSKKVVVNGVEIPRIKTHLILNMTAPHLDVSSQSSMSASQGVIVSADVNANNNALSHQSPHRLKSYDHIEDNAETSSNLASSQETGSWKAIEEMEATQRDIASFQSRMSPSQEERNKSETYNNNSLFSQRANNALKVHDVIANTKRNNSNLSMSTTSQVATDSGDPIERAPIRPYNAVPQSCIFASQNNNESSSVVLSKERRQSASQGNTNIPAASGNAKFELPVLTSQFTADNNSMLELGPGNQSQSASQQTQRQNNALKTSSDVNVNNPTIPQRRVGTLIDRVNPTMPVRVSACSKKCKILGLCIFNAFAVAIPVLIGEYCSEDSAKKDFNAVLGGMIGLGVAFAVDIYMVWSRRLS